ncbi:MAG: cupin domain-containing protein [Thermoleophilia bacterium]|jgi:quercetin dioxygenase-like cupin family protein
MSADESTATWPDPAIVAAGIYKPVFENDRIRVLDVRLQPGEIAAMHGHPDHVLYVVADSTFKITSPDGRTHELALEAGQVLWSDAEAHAAENIGTSETHTLAIELKEPAGGHPALRR